MSETSTTRYLDGECWLLADTISDLTGWELVRWGWDDEWHITVATPDGLYLDILGLHTESEMMAQGWPEPVVIDSVTDLGCDPYYDDYTTDVARRLLATLS